MAKKGEELTVTALRVVTIKVKANGHLRIRNDSLQAFQLQSDFNGHKYISPFMNWLDKSTKGKNV